MAITWVCMWYCDTFADAYIYISCMYIYILTYVRTYIHAIHYITLHYINTYRQTDIQIDRPTRQDRQTDRQTDIQTDRPDRTDKQTDRQTDIHTYRQTDIHTYISTYISTWRGDKSCFFGTAARVSFHLSTFRDSEYYWQCLSLVSQWFACHRSMITWIQPDIHLKMSIEPGRVEILQSDGWNFVFFVSHGFNWAWILNECTSGNDSL